MRLLIVGTLKGQLTTATKIAMDNGASVTHAEDLEQAMRVLRGGKGADLLLVDVALDIRDLVMRLEAEVIGAQKRSRFDGCRGRPIRPRTKPAKKAIATAIATQRRRRVLAAGSRSDACAPGRTVECADDAAAASAMAGSAAASCAGTAGSRNTGI